MAQAAKAQADGTDETNPYDATPPPGYVAVNADHALNREQRWIWVSRVVMAIAAAEALAIVALAMALATLTPLKEIIPFVTVAQEHAKGVVTVVPSDTVWTQESAVQTAWIARYVTEREEIIPNTDLLRLRWREPHYFLRLASSDDVWNTFESVSGEILHRVDANPINREVTIEQVELTDSNRRLYRVEFTTVDYRNDGLLSPALAPANAAEGEAEVARQVKEQRWTATVQVQPVFGEAVPIETLRINPLQQVVTAYSVRRER